MNSRIIVDKYCIDTENVDPLEILAAVHGRIVATENYIKEVRDRLSDIMIEIEMIKNSHTEQKNRFDNVKKEIEKEFGYNLREP